MKVKGFWFGKAVESREESGLGLEEGRGNIECCIKRQDWEENVFNKNYRKEMI